MLNVALESYRYAPIPMYFLVARAAAQGTAVVGVCCCLLADMVARSAAIGGNCLSRSPTRPAAFGRSCEEACDTLRLGAQRRR